MAGGASWGSVISTFVNYLQKIGINVSMNNLPLPPSMVKILSSIYMFYERVQEAIPQMPDFDLRSQLMVLALAIPFVLDVLFVWFINPIGVTMTHLLDLIAFGVGTYFLTSSFIGEWSLINISLIAICAVFILLRTIFTFLTKEKGDLELYFLVDEICNYYMQGILPNKKCELSFRELNLAIHKLSQIIEIAPPRANLLISYSFLFVSFLLFFLSFWCLDAFPIPWDFPDIITMLFPIIGIPLAVIFFLIYFFRLFHWGRVFLTKVKQFIRKWGLRVLLMVLDMLYIPILTVLITMMTPSQIGCPADEYLYYQVKDTDILWYPFVNHTTTCRACIDAEYRSTFCERKCSGVPELRMIQAPDLLFVNDVIRIAGGLLLYSLVIVMLGLPFLWWYIIKRNHKYIDRINVFGETEEIKYGAIIHRLRSTGVFLFEDYKSKYAMWGLFELLLKFVLMVLSLIQEIFTDRMIYGFPFYYIITVGLMIRLRPYLYTFNNLFETISESMNLLFAIFTIVAFQGVEIPEAVTFPFSIIMLVVPVLSILGILCCEGKEGTKEDKHDPTIIRKADTKKLKKYHHNHITTHKKDKNSENKNKYRSNLKEVAMSDLNMHLVETDSSQMIPLLSDPRMTSMGTRTDLYRPNTSRAHCHPEGVVTRPATPLNAVSGVPSRFPTRPQTARIYDTDSDYSDDSYSFVDPNDQGNALPLSNLDEYDKNRERIRKKRKKRQHHYRNQDRIIIDSDGNEEIISNNFELEEGMLDSILEFRERNAKIEAGQISPDEVPLTQCFTIKKKTAARRMTKMYKTLDIVLDGTTIERLTHVLNNAVIVGVIAVGWYLGALMTDYEYASNFTCG